MDAHDDPFEHLHDEAYGTAYDHPRLTAENMIFMGGREVTSLNGDWRFVLDLFDEGLRQKWFLHDDTPLEDWTHPRDYDNGDWQTIPVPSCWNMVQPEWKFFEGGAWYTRDVDLAQIPSGETLYLCIGAANYQARIFFNGVFLGLHHGGSTPFFVDLTTHAVAGKNRIQIQVNNARDPAQIPMNHFDWFNYGGIYRDVELVRLPKIFIKNLTLCLAKGGAYGVHVKVELSAPIEGAVHLTIDDLGTGQVLVHEGCGEAIFDFSPELWNPETPRLYDVTARFGDDQVRDKVGFRHVEVRGHEIFLNGQKLELRGVCVHEDDLALGKCSNEKDIRQMFAHAKELGCNILRLAHYPHHEKVAQIADEVGMMLWEEIPVYWAIDFANPASLQDATNQLQELISRDINRASVIIWGVGNENEDTDARYEFMRNLVETARAADNSRLISAACLINRQKFCIEDRLSTHLDIIGINEYFGWYEPSFDGLERLLSNSSPDRPVVISETGADAVAGNIGSDNLFTEDHQAEVLRQQAEITARYDYISGLFPWILYDFRSERRQTGAQRGWNRKGLIAEDKTTKKRGFHALAEIYGARQKRKPSNLNKSRK